MKFNKKQTSFITAISLVIAGTVHADWQSLLKSAGDVLNDKGVTSTVSSALSDDQVIQGLKEALSIGAEKAIGLLGKEGGYLNDGQVKIPLPGVLKSVSKGMRSFGQGALVDQFETTINRAAEKAVPATLSIFTQAIRDMSLEDARGILSGGDMAATEYFKRKSSSQLSAKIFPMVQDATRQTGVTASYKQLMGKAGFLGNYVDMDSLDLDRHVTAKALDGLFLKMGEQEKLIRENPVARTSDLLKQVFGQ